MALSRIESSSGVSPPSIILKRPTRFIMFDLKTSAGDSSSLAGGRSKGFIWCFDVREMLKYLPPTVSARYSYSRSGSITITSVPNIKERVSRKQGAPRESSGFQFPFCSVLQWCLRKPKYKVRMKKVFLELVGVCREDLQGPREPCQAPDRGQGPFLPACGFATALPRLFFGVVLILFRYRLDE